MKPRARSGRLRARIISWFLIPTAIAAIAVGLLVFFANERLTQDLVMERNQELTRLLAEQLSAELRQHAQPLQTVLAMYPGLFDYELATRQALLRQNIGLLTRYDGGVLLLAADGKVVAADRQPLAVLGQDWSGMVLVPGDRAAIEPVFSDILPVAPGGLPGVALTVPARGPGAQPEGYLVGVFRLETRLSALYRSMLDLGIYTTGEAQGRQAYLVDRAGRAIYHPDPARIGADLSDQETVRRVLQGETSTLRTAGLNGQPVVASYAPLPGMAWGLAVMEDWSAVTAASRGYRELLLALLALGVAVPVLVVGVGVRRITRPIADLTDAAQEVADGNLQQAIHVHTGDELETLAEQFNRMASELQESYATLERRVADRTRELAALNSVADLVSRSLDLQEILDVALAKTLETIDMEAGAAFQLAAGLRESGENGQTLALVAHRGLSAAFVVQATRLPLSSSLAGEAAELERPLVRAVSGYPQGPLKELLEAEGLQLVISVPLLVKGRVLGALNLATRAPRSVSVEELSLLASVGQQTGLAVENARLYAQAEETAVVAERNRLARELHDAVTQTLFSASLIAEVVPRLWDQKPELARQRLNELRELTRGALAEMRTLLLELRPSALIEAPLRDLLQQLAASTTGRARLPVQVQVEGECVPAPELKVALYRVAQEALNNVAKHAAASEAAIHLRCGEGWGELCVSDNGRGFDVASIPPNHLGVGIMRERVEAVGARLEIDSRIGHGTRISVRWGQHPPHDATLDLGEPL